MTTELESKLRDASATLRKLKEAVGVAVVGQKDVVDEVVLAVVAGGHALLEGAPGLGKTLLVRSLAASLELSYSTTSGTPNNAVSKVAVPDVTNAAFDWSNKS